MKSISKLVVATLIFSSIAAHARGGHRGGNGGNSIASHFATIADNVYMVWNDICANENDSEAYCNYIEDYDSLLDIDSASYVKTIGEKDPDKVRAYDGEVREAVNYTDPDEIIVNESAWKGMEDDKNVNKRRLKLVMHEYLTFIGLDSSDYFGYSTKILGMLVRKGYDLNMLNKIEGLPSTCSISIKDSNNSTVSKHLKKNMHRKGYSFKKAKEKTRYDVSIKTKCVDKTFTKSCEVKMVIKDNYTNSIAFDETVSRSGMFANKLKMTNTLTHEMLDKIESRNCHSNN